jgi:uncharacterized protein (TIGR00725 family)
MPPYLAVIGAGRATQQQEQDAERIGRKLAEAGAVLVCGGLGGVMEAACRGAKAGGGTTIGILPGSERSAANQYVDVAVATGIGEMRNALIVRSADALIAVGGEFGTLSEIALGLKAQKPVIAVGAWELRMDGNPMEGIVRAASADDAVTRALAACKLP